MRVDTRPVQWVGVALILGWVALLTLGLSRVVAALPKPEGGGGGAVAVAATLTPGEGWTSPEGAGLPTLTKGGAQILLLPEWPAPGDAEAALAELITPLEQSPDIDWHISDPQPFTTESGLEGKYAVAIAPQQFTAQYVVVVDGQVHQVLATGTDVDWTALNDEITAIAETLTVPEVSS